MGSGRGKPQALPTREYQQAAARYPVPIPAPCLSPAANAFVPPAFCWSPLLPGTHPPTSTHALAVGPPTDSHFQPTRSQTQLPGTQHRTTMSPAACLPPPRPATRTCWCRPPASRWARSCGTSPCTPPPHTWPTAWTGAPSVACGAQQGQAVSVECVLGGNVARLLLSVHVPPVSTHPCANAWVTQVHSMAGARLACLREAAVRSLCVVRRPTNVPFVMCVPCTPTHVGASPSTSSCRGRWRTARRRAR